MEYKALSAYSYRYKFINRVIAGCIASILFLSPLEIPLSQLFSTATVSPQTASETYHENTNSKVNTNEPIETSVVTYTRGEEQSESGSIESASPDVLLPNITEQLATTSTEPTSLFALALSEIKPVTKSKQLSSRATSNHQAAALITEGNTGSELVSVSLDEAGNIVATADVHGTIETAEYNADGLPLKITEGDGTVVYYKYDNQGRLLGISREAKVATVPGLRGLVQRIIAPLFATADNSDENLLFDYEADSLTTATNNTGGVEYEYDEAGLVTLETRLDGSQIEYEYDELGNVVSAIEVPADSNPVFSLQSFLRLSYAQNPILSTVREFSTYNDDSRLAHYKIALVTETLTADTAAEDVPGEASVPTTTILSEEATTTIIEIETADIVTSTSIDTTATATTTMVESVPNVSEVEADSVSETEVAPADTSIDTPIIEAIIEEITAFFRTTSTQLAVWFDSALNRTWADTDTSTTTETVDAVALSPSGEATLFDISFTYDAQGNVLSSETASGIKTTYRYDVTTDSLLATVVTTPTGDTASYTYSQDTSARITTYNGILFGYTDAGVLATAGNETYTYDEQGNRVSVAGTEVDATYTYTGNRLMSVAYANGRTTTYTYDDRGAVIQSVDSIEGVTDFTYNLSGAIASVSRGDTRIEYTYDALNRRATRTSKEDGTISYHYNSNQLKRVTDESGTTLREYFYTPTNLLTAIKVGDVFYHAIINYNRSLVGLVDTTTGFLYTINYDTWGRVVENNLPITLDIGYIGAFTEPAFGYSILGPRVYNPAIGRFLSKDPLPGVQVDLLSQNEYIYAKNDPVNQYDPSGHASELATDSASPKRSLIEINIVIDALELDLADAKATLEITDQADNEAYALATLDVANVESALSELYSIKAETLAVITQNEAVAKATAESESLPATTATSTVVWGIEFAEELLTTSVNTVSTTTESLDETATISESQPLYSTDATTATLVISEEGTTEISSSTEETNSPASFSTSVIEPTTETTSSTTVDTVSFGVSDQLFAVGSFLFGKTLLKAEAKKKKSKAKKAKKSKKKVSSKVKEKQATKVKSLSSLKKQLSSLQKKLAKAQNKNANRKITRRELDKINREIQSITVGVVTHTVSLLSHQVDKVISERNTVSLVAEEKAKAQVLATAANNLNTNTNNQVKIIAVSPTAPAQVAVTAPQSANVSAPQIAFAPTAEWWKTATSVGISLVPLVGEAYDFATLITGKDPITGERLTPFTSVLTFAGLMSGVGSGGVARKLGTEALERLAKELGVTTDELLPIAEKVAANYKITSIDDLEKLKDKLSIDSFVEEVRVAAKEVAERTVVAIKIVSRSDLPEGVQTSLSNLTRSNWTRSWEGQANGRVWQNIETQLPTNLTYTEWDLYKVSSAADRGLERIVKGSDGSLYYTNNHYGKVNNGQPPFVKIQ